MKKLLAITLAIVMLAATLTSCGTTLVQLEDGTYDRGAVINMYLADEVFNFDPQEPITDDSQLKAMRLLFEGLTKLNSKGKWEKAMMESYTVNENDRDGDGFSVTIELKETKWTDGRTVQAGDFVTSWKRLVDANNRGEAASLLYDIKNAKEINLGDVSVDDLGVSAVDTYTLKVTFRNKNVDLDRFFTNLSSIALVPIREDVIARYGDDWAKVPAAIVTNGPFTLKAVEKDGELRLERSSYYYRNTEENDYLDKYVIPYRLMTNHSIKLEDQVKNLDKEVFYLGNLPLADRAKYEKDAEISDLMMTHTYYFNTNNKLFAKPEVRRALSLALDREKIAEILTFAKAATGVIPEGVFDTSYKNSFREEGGELIKTSANVAEAKKLLSAAGVKNGTFSITIRDTEADEAVAKYVKGVWEDLGFKVTIKKASTNEKGSTIDPATEATIEYTIDEYQSIYDNSEFDVIAVDMNMIAPDAFNALSQFAADFSGNGVNMLDPTYPYYGHVTGYDNDKYTKLIEKAYDAKNEKDRAAALHEAEKLLVQDMPVCPLVTLQSAFIKSKILSGFETDYYGVTDFKQVKMKDYMNYKEEETETMAPPVNPSEKK